MNQICEHHLVRSQCKICVSKSGFRRFKKQIAARSVGYADGQQVQQSGITSSPADALIMIVSLAVVGNDGDDVGALVLDGDMFEVPQLGSRGQCVRVGDQKNAIRFRMAQIGNILVFHMDLEFELSLDVSQRLYEEVDTPVMLWATARPELVCR